MAIKQVVTSTGEPVVRGADWVVIGTPDPTEPVYLIGYSPGVLFVEIVEDEDE